MRICNECGEGYDRTESHHCSKDDRSFGDIATKYSYGLLSYEEMAQQLKGRAA